VKKLSFLTNLFAVFAVGALAVALLVTSSVAGAGSAEADRPAQEPEARWVNTWTAMPQLTEESNMPPPPFTQDNLVMADATLRQTVHVTTGGEQIRLRFSNAFGGANLPLTAVSVALPLGGQAGVSAIEPGSSQPVTFSGASSVVVPVGAQIVSDPIDLDVAPGANLTVTTYLAEGQASNDITSHPGSRTTSYLLAGDHTEAEDLSGATATDHWYFLSGVEAWSPGTTSAAVIVGDSLTDGRSSTTNGNNRWPDQLFDRLQTEPDTADVALLNQAAGGNAVLRGGLGPAAMARFDRDVLAQSGVEWLVLFEGVNDIGSSPATAAGAEQIAAELITAYDQMITRAHAHGIRVYGATITPFGNNEMYDDAGGFHESARQTVNEWIRTSGRFDAVIDFDEAIRDPQNPAQLLPDMHDGDWLHLNPEGYGLLADAVPAELFRTQPLARDFAFN
jgi:lysophospholipase L1-like esterase